MGDGWEAPNVQFGTAAGNRLQYVRQFEVVK